MKKFYLVTAIFLSLSFTGLAQAQPEPPPLDDQYNGSTS